MARDEDDFRIRPGKVRDRWCADERAGSAVRRRPTSFIGEVHQAIRRAGGNPNRLAGTGKGGGRFNARGRGVAAALTLKGRSAWSRDGSGARTRARRVAVKARVVKLNPQRGAARGRQFVSAKAVDAHLRYLERDGVTRDGEKGQVYSAERDVEDGRAFVERGREDRHQFRFIVSAEDGVELSDPRETTVHGLDDVATFTIPADAAVATLGEPIVLGSIQLEGEPAQELDHLFERTIDKTALLVDEHWPAVCRVAKALMNNSMLERGGNRRPDRRRGVVCNVPPKWYAKNQNGSAADTVHEASNLVDGVKALA